MRLGKLVAWWAAFGVIAALAAWTLTSAVRLHASHATCAPQQPLTSLLGVPEASGLAVSRRNPGVLWTANDSGQPVLFGIDAHGKIVASIDIPGATVIDWEDVSVGPCPAGSCIYIADIGDNRGVRRDVMFYRFPEPRIDEHTSAPPEVFHATYEDGPHDAEAAFVTADAQVFVVTKANPGELYRLDGALKPDTVLRLVHVAPISFELSSGKHSKRTKVTDAETSSDGKWVAVRTNEEVAIYPTGALISGNPVAPTLVGLGGLYEPQGEGVALGADGTLFLAGEGGGHKVPGTFASLSCRLWH